MTYIQKLAFSLVIVLGLAACSQPEETTSDESLTPENASEALRKIESELNEVEAELAAAEAEIQRSVEEATSDVTDTLEDLGMEAKTGADELDPGQAYLHINAQKPNVKVTASGLQFEILESGEGASPGLTSRVVTHYRGSFIDGQVFDSSLDRGEPAEFPVNRVIPGWTEALQMMKEGDKWRLVIPSDLAYGERGAGGGRIPPNSVLVFEVELIEVKEG